MEKQKYFNVNLEFNHHFLKNIIDETIKKNGKGYVCVVDANVLTIAQKDNKFIDIVNNSLVNTCDGSSIATLASIIHKKKFRAYNGPELFSFYIEKKYSQLLLGSNESIAKQIKDILKKKGVDETNIFDLPLPFKSVEEFDYVAIAKQINTIQPEIIWVSLGAPKQEFFIANLLPYINKGVLIGIGAAFNFYIGKLKIPNARIGTFKFIWLGRIISEPKKQILRVLPYIKILPKLYLNEKAKFNSSIKKA